MLGFVRDTIIARVFGAGVASDAFFVAFKLPNLLRRIFAEGAFSQAFVPILADGLKWMGYYPGPRVFFSLGAFFDQISEQESFSTYDYQFVTRIGWLPVASVPDKTVWHTAVMSRVGRPDEGSISFRSRPEDSLAPFFVETRSMAAELAGTTGFETYYRKGSWMVGGEFGVQNVKRKARVQIEEIEGLTGLLPIAVRLPQPLSAAAIFYDEESGLIIDVEPFRQVCIDSDPVCLAGAPSGLGQWTTLPTGDGEGSWASVTVAPQTGVVIATSVRPACGAGTPPAGPFRPATISSARRDPTGRRWRGSSGFPDRLERSPRR